MPPRLRARRRPADSADVYSAGESERITGKALAGCRGDAVLATTFFIRRRPARIGGLGANACSGTT